MKALINQHKQAIEQVLARMRLNLAATLMMCAVMGVTLCLPSVLYVIIENVRSLAGNVESEPRVSLFLNREVTGEQKKALDAQLKDNSEVERYHFVSKESAWQQLREEPSTASVAANLEKNPLPDAYFVTPKSSKPEEIEALQKTMQTWDGVELAQVDSNWIKRLHAILELGQKGVLVLVTLLAFALVAIIGNTIRLQILTQREEIEVSKLIGATNSFIRRPFLYAGVLYGLGGGLIAWVLLVSIVSLFNYSIADIARLYESHFELSLPGWQTNLTMIFSAIGLGFLSSYIAVTQSLSKL